MAKLTGDEYAEKWAANLGAATEAIRHGVMTTDKNPMEEAIKQKAKLKQNFIASVDNGTWESGLRKVSKSDWQSRTIEVGIPRIPEGANKAKAKMAAFGTALMSHIDAGIPKIKDMPTLTLDQSIAKSAAWIRHMATMRYKGKR